jgi:Site-specific recombinases, DNA invertase Pin homologs
MLIGYARCSTDKQDLRVQKGQLQELGVERDRIYVDHGYTGRKRERPGLKEAMAATRAGDVFVVTKLDRLARSVKDASAIAQELEDRGVALQLGKSTYDPSDPLGKMFFNLTALFAEFEADLVSQRTREGLAIAKAKGRMKGRPSSFTKRQIDLIQGWLDSGDYSQVEIAELMKVHPSTISRIARKLQAGENASG